MQNDEIYFEKIARRIIAERASVWAELAKSLSCGNCGENTTIESPFTCKTCGRMLCGSCGEWCKDHAPNISVQWTGLCACKIFIPSAHSTALVCRNCGKPPRR